MKRAIIGGFISIIGTIWTLAVIVYANSYAISEWRDPPGKLLTQISESNLGIWFAFFIATIILGIVIMAIEYFKQDN